MTGHRVIGLYPSASGWRAVCECGHESRGKGGGQRGRMDARSAHSGHVADVEREAQRRQRRGAAR